MKKKNQHKTLKEMMESSSAKNLFAVLLFVTIVSVSMFFMFTLFLMEG